MFLLDTNVVSELRKARSGKADANVVAWASAQQASHLFLSVITVLELETGILLLERRDPAQGQVLRNWLEQYVLPAFVDRILPIDTIIARLCARPGQRKRCDDRGYRFGAWAHCRHPQR